MCSQRWPVSQEANKSKGTCSICFETHQLHLRGNTVHLHGPRAARCQGSNRLPLAPHSVSQGVAAPTRSPAPQGIVTAPQGLVTALSSPRSLPVTHPALSSTVSGSAAPGSQSQTQSLPSAAHPVVKCPIIKHIPKSARPACCSALAGILSNIVQNRANFSALSKLFDFCPSVLSIPPKSGSNVSISSIIKARLTGSSGSASAINSSR
jgi:hypothetical protein